jgi:hypothetical protein
MNYLKSSLPQIIPFLHEPNQFFEIFKTSELEGNFILKVFKGPTPKVL